MRKIMRLSKGIKLRVKTEKTNDGIEIHLQFKKRVRIWLFRYFEDMWDHLYIISVYDFWDMGTHGKGGIFEGQPLRSTGTYGENFEAWKPRDFNLDKRIAQIHREIIKERATAKRTYSHVMDTLK